MSFLQLWHGPPYLCIVPACRQHRPPLYNYMVSLVKSMCGKNFPFSSFYTLHIKTSSITSLFILSSPQSLFLLYSSPFPLIPTLTPFLPVFFTSYPFLLSSFFPTFPLPLLTFLSLFSSSSDFLYLSLSLYPFIF